MAYKFRTEIICFTLPPINKIKKQKMRILILTLLLILTLNTFGQVLEKGIYRGQKLPFEICLFTYADTIMEVEYFYEKAGQVFGHVPAKRLIINMESFVTKPVYKSKDDSITVYYKKDHYLIKRVGSGKVKVYRTKESNNELVILRNRNRLFTFSHNLYKELNQKSEFDEIIFWDKFNSYELEKLTSLNSNEFNKKLEQVNKEIKKNQ